MRKKMISLGLCTTLMLSALCGCGKQSHITYLTDKDSGGAAVTDSGPNSGQSGSQTGGSSGQGNVQSGSQTGGISGQTEIQPADASTVTDFTVRLLQKSLSEGEKDNNILLSPVSVLYALSMTANGANGQTLAQMEEVLGASVPALNTYLHQYRTSLPEGDGYQLRLANSIWFKDIPRFTVNEDFLAVNTKWYDTDLYKAPFDSSTLKEINKWVSKNTDKMIPEILDDIPEDAVMYLINALAFDAKWDTDYDRSDVRKSDFTQEDGAKCQTELMYSTENTYLQDDNAQGFIKYYKDKKYAFAALLPNEGISVADYLETLDGQALHELLSNPVNVSVEAAIPKFETDYDVEMSDIFKSLGMTDAFDSKTADFSGISSGTEGRLFISRILHKTFIAVDEKGTKAGAATAVEMREEGAVMCEHRVILNRPFVYMIIDCEENVPVFIGTMMSVDS